jgi:hypothetical protein
LLITNENEDQGRRAVSGKYEQYKEDMTAQIVDCVQKMGCQPILFVGSGLSRRYFNGPSWDELLSHLAKNCPLITKDYAYYKQSIGDLPAIGQKFAELYREWAWGDGRKLFSEDLFGADVPRDAYLKSAIAKYFKEITPSSVSGLQKMHKNEISALQSIRPHAIITTNYDGMLEILFPEYEPIVGQKIIQGTPSSIGEIFKIHGCVSDPESMVLTTSDYEIFTKRKKYLSAKLLAYFSEHPLVFVGYGAGDPNICAILSDIDEALPISGGVISNVFILERREPTNADSYPAREKLIPIEDSRSVRVNAIEAESFDWVYDAFGSQPHLSNISPKLMRALFVRSYELVRHDMPRTKVQADFSTLEGAVESNESFAKMFGLTTVNDGTAHAANYPYTLTEVANKLGHARWQKIDPLLKRIKAEKGVDIKETDNRYHSLIMYGKSKVHKYSKFSVELFKLMKAGKDYELEL